MKNWRTFAAIIALLMAMTACPTDSTSKETVIDIAAIAGVSAPVAGLSPAGVISETAQYTGTVTWNGYTATITLTAKTGYTLQGVKENFFTVAGAAATNAANSGLVTAVFPVTYITSTNGVEMAFIPGGSFLMGSEDPEDNISSECSAYPPHRVTLSGFYMGKYTVTQAQYEAVMGTNPSYHTTAKSRPPDSGETDGKRPVESVSWYEAIEFCNKLSDAENLSLYYTIDKSQKDPNNTNSSDALKWTITLNNTAKGYRLPTEAEWEYACRAGTTTGWYTGDTEDDKLQAAAWCSDNANSKTHEVGKKTANAWGLYDMHGNVWEWCWGFYGNYKSEAQTDPTGPSSGAYGILRGGAYNQSAQICRSAIRLYAYYPQDGGDSFGFRLARP